MASPVAIAMHVDDDNDETRLDDDDGGVRFNLFAAPEKIEEKKVVVLCENTEKEDFDPPSLFSNVGDDTVQTTSTQIFRPPSPLAFSEEEFSLENNQLFTAVDVTIVNAVFIVCCFEKVKRRADVTTARLYELCRLLKLGNKTNNRTALFVAVAKNLVKCGFISVSSKKPTLRDIRFVKNPFS